jgi:hypothetical protein
MPGLYVPDGGGTGVKPVNSGGAAAAAGVGVGVGVGVDGGGSALVSAGDSDPFQARKWPHEPQNSSPAAF